MPQNKKRQMAGEQIAAAADIKTKAEKTAEAPQSSPSRNVEASCRWTADQGYILISDSNRMHHTFSPEAVHVIIDSDHLISVPS